MKILIISWDSPPSGKAASILVNNLCKELKDDVVLVGEKIINKQTPKLNYHIEYLNPFFFKISIAYQYTRWIKFFSCYSKLLQLHKKNNFDAILCVFPNDFFLALAYLFATKNKIKFYVWLHNLYLENMKGYRKKIAEILQPKVFKHAKNIFAISLGMSDYLKRSYTEHASKIKIIKHGFYLNKNNRINYKSNEIINFSYTGSFHSTCEDSSIRMCKAVLDNFDCRLHVFGSSNKEKFIKNEICGDNVTFHGFLHQTEFEQKLKEMQIHLLPHGFSSEKFSSDDINTIFSTRSIPLFCSGVPILANSPPGAFFTEFLESQNCCHLVKTKNIQELIDGVNLINNDKSYRDEIINNAYYTSQQFDIKIISKDLKKFLNES